ncbi:MAG: metallophosphoesterase [Thermoplasmata archaeon]|nr:metallophosphoesterase [Thermoplasmata archaeon]
MLATERLTPEAILNLQPEDADELLDRLEREVPVSEGLAALGGAPLEEAIVFGDTHGDWRSTVLAAGRFLERPDQRALVGLGDYIDRAPEDCGEGSVANALFLLGLAAEFPGRVVLVQGNHETFRRIPVVPHNLPEEVDLLWGPDEDRYLRILHLLERGPLAVRTESGAYLAHGGFPLEPSPGGLSTAFRDLDEDHLAEIVWGECSLSPTVRGVVRRFDERNLEEFFARSGTRVFLRGHDPGLIGRSIYSDRCLTLHTCRTYERFGGVLIARVPLHRAVAKISEVPVEHLPSEGQVYPVPV